MTSETDIKIILNSLSVLTGQYPGIDTNEYFRNARMAAERIASVSPRVDFSEPPTSVELVDISPVRGSLAFHQQDVSPTPEEMVDIPPALPLVDVSTPKDNKLLKK